MSFLQRFVRTAFAAAASSSSSSSSSSLLLIDALARRRAFATSSSSSSSAAAAATNVFTVKHDAPLASRIEQQREAERNAKSNVGRPGYNEKGHKILSEYEIAEIKRLRAADPAVWTQRALARRFECSRLQIGIHASSALRQQQHEFVQGVFAQRRLTRDPAVRRERLKQYVQTMVQQERDSWQTKLARKQANKLAATATIEANEQARVARRAAQDAERALADKNRALSKAQKAAKLGKVELSATPSTTTSSKKTSSKVNNNDNDDDDDIDIIETTKTAKTPVIKTNSASKNIAAKKSKK